MIRKHLPPRRHVAALPPSRRQTAGMTPAPLLLSLLSALAICLLAAGCGQDDQRVPESYPSGERPAPLSKSDLAAAKAELPPAPPPEVMVAPEPPGEHAAAGARSGSPERGMGGAGHLRLSGSYQVDADAGVTCTVVAGRGLQLTLDTARAPIFVELSVSDFLGAGTYVAAARVRARDTPDTLRPSAGEARIEIQVTSIGQPHVRSLLSGTFTGAYGGPGIQGQVGGSFDRCDYPGTLP